MWSHRYPPLILSVLFQPVRAPLQVRLGVVVQSAVSDIWSPPALILWSILAVVIPALQAYPGGCDEVDNVICTFAGVYGGFGEDGRGQSPSQFGSWYTEVWAV
jgi:hypothetical protein